MKKVNIIEDRNPYNRHIFDCVQHAYVYLASVSCICFLFLCMGLRRFAYLGIL